LADRLPRTTRPLAATGQLALTIYVTHLLLLNALPEALKTETVQAASFTVGVFMLLAAAICTLWRAVLSRGPLEAALNTPWRTIEHLNQRVIRPLIAAGRRSCSTGTGR
jgi:uncharacterized membrane protein YeiB